MVWLNNEIKSIELKIHDNTKSMTELNKFVFGYNQQQSHYDWMQ